MPNDARHTMEIAIVNGKLFYGSATKNRKESKNIVKCTIQDTEKW